LSVLLLLLLLLLFQLRLRMRVSSFRSERNTSQPKPNSIGSRESEAEQVGEDVCDKEEDEDEDDECG
jgi:hypothetical protein